MHYDTPVPSGGRRACRKASLAQLNAAYSTLASHGIGTLAYGNYYMYGWKMEKLDSPINFTAACTPMPTDVYQQINCSLNLDFRARFAAAALYDMVSDKQIVYECGSARCGLAIVDPGEPAYKRFIVEQHHKQVVETPMMVGVALDEQQFLGQMNMRRDDGVGWHDGKPCASILRSFINVSAAVAGEALHPAGKGLLINTHVYRLDMFQNVDGILDEYGDHPAKMLTNGILGLAKPVLAWDHCGGTVKSQRDAKSCATDGSTFDEFLAQHLYLGTQPMGPFVNQSHGVLPSTAHLQMFEDWGPLFKAIRGKQWLLTPHAATVRSPRATIARPKVNVFAVGASTVAVAVVAGGEATDAMIELAPLRGASWTSAKATVLLPGVGSSRALPPVNSLASGGATLLVPLVRGAALCLFKHLESGAALLNLSFAYAAQPVRERGAGGW